MLATLAYLAPRAPALAAELSIAKIELTSGQFIDVNNFDDGRSIGTARHSASTIEVTIENRGEASAMITAVDADIAYKAQFEGCEGIGGSVTSGGEYNIRVPSEGESPLRSSASLSFTVEPASFERIDISIGPDEIGDVELPFVYGLSLAFSLSNGARIVTERIAVLSPSLTPDIVAVFNDLTEISGFESCLHRNREILDQAIAGSDHISTDLHILQQAIAGG